jgi:hypothetical protein
VFLSACILIAIVVVRIHILIIVMSILTVMGRALCVLIKGKQLTHARYVHHASLLTITMAIIVMDG